MPVPTFIPIASLFPIPSSLIPRFLLSHSQIFIVPFPDFYCPIPRFLLSHSQILIVPFPDFYCPIPRFLLSHSQILIVPFPDFYCPIPRFLLSHSQILIVPFPDSPLWPFLRPFLISSSGSTSLIQSWTIAHPRAPSIQEHIRAGDLSKRV